MIDAGKKQAKPTSPPKPRAANPHAPEVQPVERVSFKLFTQSPAIAATGSDGDSPIGAPEPETTLASNSALFGVIVDDGLPLLEGQITLTEFLDSLRPRIEEVGDEELAGSGQTTRDCPYIPHWLDFYANHSAAHAERAIARFASPLRTDLDGLREALLLRVRRAVRVWARSGGREIESPEGIEPLGSDDRMGGSGEPSAVQRKSLDGGTGPPPASNPAAIRARLGAGEPLGGDVQGRMERGFGRSFADVRLHADGGAAQMASGYAARAFTVGNHVAFGAGQYRPGTLVGDALIAHELAHVLQQHGSNKSGGSVGALEADADRAVIGAAARGGLTGIDPGGMAAARDRLEPSALASFGPRYSGGLRLQRCDNSPERPRIGPGNTASPEGGATDAGVADAAAAQPAPSVTSVEVIDLSDVVEWKPIASDDAVLMVHSGDRLYLLPAKGLVFEAAPVLPGTRPQVFGMPAAGHAGVYVVRTRVGAGILVDAGGTRSGRPSALVPQSLAVVRARLGIETITGVLISHTHADHVANLTTFVNPGPGRPRMVNGSNVWVYPGWEQARTGPLASALNTLRSAAYTPFGFGPNWQPTQLTTLDVSGVTRATLRVGDATIEVVTRSSDLNRYIQELQAGGSGTRFADAASMFTRVRLTGANFDFVIVGDIRGSTIVGIRDQMGQVAFDQFVSNTRVLGGFQHHLGAVNSPEDVEGIRLLLRSAKSAEFQLTAIVQTDQGRNMDMVRALQEAGVRVLALGAIDPARPSNVTVRSTGEVSVRGATEFAPSPIVQEARSRIENLSRAANVLETSPDLVRVEGGNAAEVARGLRTEADRLRERVYQRQQLATEGLHQPAAQRPNTAPQIAQVDVELRAVRGVAASVGADSIRTLRRLSERAEEIRTETQLARQRGASSERLRKLVAEVHPDFARAILMDEYGRAMNERGRIRAQRRSEQRLREQINLQRSLTVPGRGPVGARPVGPRIVVGGMIALEVFNQIAPFIMLAQSQQRADRAREFYPALRAARWWHEKGITVPVRGRREGQDVVAEEQVRPGVLRRVWEDTPEKNRTKEEELPDDVRTSRPFDALYIPPLGDWTDSVMLWDTFRLWVTTHVRNYDDYASEFREADDEAVRYQGDFTEANWQVRTGRINTDGHVEFRWESSDELTRIMRTTAERVIETTTREVQQEWEQRGRPLPPRPPTIRMPGDRGGPAEPGERSGRPTAHARFAGTERTVFSTYETRELDRFQFWNATPYFLVYGNEFAPTGYVLVGGADYETHAAIRAQHTWHEDINERVPIPKWYTPLHETIPREPEYTPRERAALDACRAGGPGVYRERQGHDPTYRADVLFPHLAPNTWARLLVRRSNLVFDQ